MLKIQRIPVVNFTFVFNKTIVLISAKKQKSRTIEKYT